VPRRRVSSSVLDASALLALLNAEPGAHVVEAIATGAAIQDLSPGLSPTRGEETLRTDGKATNMRPQNIVVGQNVDRTKVERSRALRREMTAAETTLWQALRAGRTGGLRFRRQQIIDGFIIDFYCHAAGLVIEVDGAIHELQAEYDAARERVLESRGLRILRINNAEVETDLPAVLLRILRATGALHLTLGSNVDQT
jgi:very-short-patch-repair endonuclease